MNLISVGFSILTATALAQDIGTAVVVDAVIEAIVAVV